MAAGSQASLSFLGALVLVVAQLLSHVWLFSTPWTVAHQASLSFTISWSLLKLMSIQFGDAIQPYHPLLSPSSPAFDLFQHQGLFQWVSSLHQVAKVLEFQLQHQSFNEYSGLISLKVDWLDLCSPRDSQESSPSGLKKSHLEGWKRWWLTSLLTDMAGNTPFLNGPHLATAHVPRRQEAQLSPTPLWTFGEFPTTVTKLVNHGVTRRAQVFRKMRLCHLLQFPWPHIPLLNILKTILVQLFQVLLLQ